MEKHTHTLSEITGIDLPSGKLAELRDTEWRLNMVLADACQMRPGIDDELQALLRLSVPARLFSDAHCNVNYASYRMDHKVFLANQRISSVE